MPTARMPLPMMLMAKLEKKLESASTSVSMRSVSSPGRCALWKTMSSPRQWRSKSSRSAFVAVQATRSLTFTLTMVRTWVTAAMARKSTPWRSRTDVGVPAIA